MAADAGWEHPEPVYQTGSPEAGTARELAMSAYLARDLAGSSGSRPEIGTGPDAPPAHIDHHGYLCADRAGSAAPGA